MQNMYPGKVNSPQTELASAIDDEQTTIPLLDASVLPDPPNLATIGTGEDAETILYEGIEGNDLTGVTRGFQGTAKSWSAGVKVARLYTAYDHDAFIENINSHAARHAADGADPLTPEMIGAAPEMHAIEHITGGSDVIPDATTSSSGLMSAEDKTQLTKHRKSTDEYNRPVRKLPPSFGSWQYVGRAISNDETWKDQYAGIGYDVVWDDETQRYAMIYCGSQNGGTTTFGIAYSDDAKVWEDYDSNPIFSPTGVSGDPDQGGVTFPQLVRYDNKWYMFYIGFPGTGYEVGEPKICYATADSLLGPWTRHGAIITKEMFPPGDGITVLYRPTVLKFGDTWYMFLNAGPSIGTEDIYYFTASSPDGPWSFGAKVLSGTQFDTANGNTLASDPEVIRYGDLFVMLVWSSGGGIHMAYCDVSEFPDTWHPVDEQLNIPTAGPRRPLWVETPEDRLLILNTVNSTAIDVYRQGATWRPKLVKLTKAEAQPANTNTTTVINLDTDLINDFFMRSGNRIIIREAGVYQVTGMVAFAANATGSRSVFIRKNGVEIARTRVPAVNGGPTHLSVTTIERFANQDYIELCVNQDSGSTINVEVYPNGISPVLMAVKISD